MRTEEAIGPINGQWQQSWQAASDVEKWWKETMFLNVSIATYIILYVWCIVENRLFTEVMFAHAYAQRLHRLSWYLFVFCFLKVHWVRWWCEDSVTVVTFKRSSFSVSTVHVQHVFKLFLKTPRLHGVPDSKYLNISERNHFQSEQNLKVKVSSGSDVCFSE